MRKKASIIILMALSILFICGCSTSNKENELVPEKNEETEGVQEVSDNLDNIEENQLFFVENLKVGETGAKGAAQILESVGCGQIQTIDELEDDGRCFAFWITDDAGKTFYITMGYDGYIGYVKGADGEFLYAPEE